MYKLTNIDVDGGRVELAEILEDGTSGGVTKVDTTEFIATYRRTTKSVECISDWQSKAPCRAASYNEAVCKAYVSIALQHVSSIAATELRVQVKPSKAVFADASFAPNKLVIVPETTKMTVVADEHQLSSFDCSVTVGGVKTNIALMPSFSDTFVSPAWAVKVSDDPNSATVHVARRIVSVATGSKGCEASSIEVSVPVLTNNKKLAKGAELIMFKALAKKAPKRPPPLTLQTTAAKAKKSK